MEQNTHTQSCQENTCPCVIWQNTFEYRRLFYQMDFKFYLKVTSFINRQTFTLNFLYLFQLCFLGSADLAFLNSAIALFAHFSHSDIISDVQTVVWLYLQLLFQTLEFSLNPLSFKYPFDPFLGGMAD